MVQRNFSIQIIDLATEGWSEKEAARFCRLTRKQFRARIQEGLYPEGMLVNGKLRWHPDLMRMFKSINDEGFVPRMGFLKPE